MKGKKVNKYRGHTTHGGGHRKKRRGAGSRGGRGNAGSGKRAGHKQRPLGSHGFTSHHKQTKSLNLKYFTPEKLEILLAQQKISKEGEVYIVNLPKLGYQKLLGLGSLSAKVKFIGVRCSVKAAEKISAAGGEVA
tara:strand:+ start:421 stop:825 length:405 start_codon:yes stop_codon:yes gene_type:complete